MSDGAWALINVAAMLPGLIGMPLVLLYGRRQNRRHEQRLSEIR